MTLPHGIENSSKRIEIRAEYIVMVGEWKGCEADATDINSDEQMEIEAAKTLAKDWARK